MFGPEVKKHFMAVINLNPNLLLQNSNITFDINLRLEQSYAREN